jgi:hypothetical protein
MSLQSGTRLGVYELVGSLGAGGESSDIYVTALQGVSDPRPFVKTPAYEGGARFSPDGKWLVYVSDESGRAQVYIRPFPGLDQNGRFRPAVVRSPSGIRTGGNSSIATARNW